MRLQYFAGDLARMYQRYAAKRGWGFSIVDTNETSLNGYKSLVAEVAGTGALEALKQESGVHRVHGFPKRKSRPRAHLNCIGCGHPEVEPKQVQINDGDIEATFSARRRSWWANVNKVETAVRILHKPSGIVNLVTLRTFPHANREKAMVILRAKLYAIQIEKESAALGATRREQIGSGDRSEKIRTTLPRRPHHDHRIGKNGAASKTSWTATWTRLSRLLVKINRKKMAGAGPDHLRVARLTRRA